MAVKLVRCLLSVENGRHRSCCLVVSIFKILLVLVCIEGTVCRIEESWSKHLATESGAQNGLSHSCIHDEILHQRRRYGRKEYSVTPQVYQEISYLKIHRKGRGLLEASETEVQKDLRQPIRIYLNYEAVGHSPDRDCRGAGDIVKLGEPPASLVPGMPACNPHGDPPVFGDCWYNCTIDDVTGEDKKHRLRKALGQTADWFRSALSVEPVKGNLHLSGYSACGQDGGVQLPR